MFPAQLNWAFDERATWALTSSTDPCVPATPLVAGHTNSAGPGPNGASGIQEIAGIPGGECAWQLAPAAPALGAHSGASHCVTEMGLSH